MTPQKVKCKLTAILSADVNGYSRLMGENEEGTGAKPGYDEGLTARKRWVKL